MGLFESLAVAAAPSIVSFLGGERRNSAQSSMSQRQMDFQEEMSNTAYRRAMTDMKEAGLNPILAGKLGGASTPQGSQPILHDSITPAINTGLMAMQTESNVQKQEAEVEKIAEEVKKVETEIEKLGYDMNLSWSNVLVLAEQARLLRNQTEQVKANTTATNAENVEREIMAEFFSSNEFVAIANKLGINGSILKVFFVKLLGMGRAAPDKTFNFNINK